MRGIVVAAAMAGLAFAATPADADNAMGYRELSSQEAAGLPRNHGMVGMDVDRAERLNDGGLTFDILRVKSVRRDSPSARAGLVAGDQIIAVDGLVFQSVASFAAYVGSTQPGSRINVDYMPANGGPQQAQRVAITVGGAGQAAAPATGMSTGTKVAIGVGAAALFGCYELGCFSHHTSTQQQPQNGAMPR